MKLVCVDGEAIEDEALREAAQALRDGALVAFPTETVYGLGANALDAQAVARIFEAKGRPSTNPLIVHVTSVEAAQALVAAWPPKAQQLAQAFWPGPLTLILPKASTVPDAVTAGLDAVAVRSPAHPVAQALLRLAGVPVAAPSANRYTQVSPTTAQHVAKGLGDRIDWLVDGGATQVGLESTVLSLVQDEPVLLRPGMISAAQLEQVIGPIRSLTNEIVDEQVAAPSPGLARRHYSPDAAVMLYGAGVADDPLPALDAASEQAAAAVVVVALGDAAAEYHELARPWGWLITLPAQPELYARYLYKALHRVDELGAQVAYLEAPPRDEAAWAAVWNRLSRAVERG